ncbi:hypothetical protein I4U23_027447 [Adineta vaga]|nr:hypothetical protein I4U23_027447 [Adineta vaga]
MSFEILPDEILLMIYSYLNDIEILHAFNDLNTRLNSTIINYRKHIHLIHTRYGQFNQYCCILTHTNLSLQNVLHYVMYNDMITHFDVYIKTTNDLMILLHYFRNLYFLSISIQNFQASPEQQSFDHIFPTTLNTFHLEDLHGTDRSILNKVILILVNISSLHHVKFQICLDPVIGNNEDGIDYLNGQEWNRIRMQFHHLLDFDCTLWTVVRSYDVNDLSEYIIDSFAQF